MRIGVILDLSEDQMDELKLLAFLHDIGKIAVPDSILEKPGALTPKEWEEMKQHCEIGYRIAISAPELSPIANSILSHHERWDGSGYPQGLKGKQIPLLARIIAVLDAYDTMTQGRIYKKEISEQEALAEIVRCAGTQFDPEVVTAFQKLMKPEILSQQLEQAREVLNQIVREKGLNSIEAMEQSRKVDHIINQISKLGKIEEADLTKQFSGFN
jgi:HD-GYP domain-containing protein (c-di-GMP phosphodiesterase class II)